MVTSEIREQFHLLGKLLGFGQNARRGKLLGFGQNASEIIPQFHEYTI